MGSMRDQVVRRWAFGSSPRHMGSNPHPTSANDATRQYVADSLTKTCRSTHTPCTACISIRAQNRRRYLQRGCSASLAVRGGCLEGIVGLPIGIRPNSYLSTAELIDQAERAKTTRKEFGRSRIVIGTESASGFDEVGA